MVILITGASKGVGLEVTKQLCQNNNIIAISRSDILFSHQNLIGIKGDINDNKTIEKCWQTIHQNFSKLDVIINNAGVLINKPFENIRQEELQTIYSTNVFAPFNLIQKMLPLLKKSENAHIVNITSMGGVTGTQKFAGLSAYSSSKGALSILTECLAEELLNFNIKCNALALGAVQTEMLSNAFPDYKAPISAKEIAEFIAWFSLNGQKFFNGKILPVALSTP
ncbi:MAG: SDR family oxidoreductase [Bacteroidia bacterium]